MCVTGRGRGEERRDEELSQLRQLRRGARDAGRGGVQCKAKWGGEAGGGRVLLPWYHRLTTAMLISRTLLLSLFTGVQYVETHINIGTYAFSRGRSSSGSSRARYHQAVRGRT